MDTIIERENNPIEDTYLTVALFDRQNNYLCDLTGNEAHIKTQMLNIYKFKSNLSKISLARLGFEIKLEEIRLKTNNNLTLLTSVIQ